MAGTSSIDIMGSLNDALSAITGSKVDLSLSINNPFTEQAQSIEDNQTILQKMKALKKAEAERTRLNAVGARAKIDKGLRAPFETRISGR